MKTITVGLFDDRDVKAIMAEIAKLLHERNGGTVTHTTTRHVAGHGTAYSKKQKVAAKKRRDNEPPYARRMRCLR